MLRIGVDKRRARLIVRHRLAPPNRAPGPEEAARAVVAFHSSDPATVFLSARARMSDAGVTGMERALYEDRTLVRMHGMRRTLFVVPRDLGPFVQAGANHQIAASERRRLHQMLEGAGIASDPARWLAGVEQATLTAVAARGEATAAQLGRDVPFLREQILLAAGKKYEANVSVSTRLLFLLGMEGRLVRGRPLGSWIASQYRWLPIESVWPDGLPTVTPAEGKAEVIRRWLAAFGPGTMTDLRWWTGWTVAEVARALNDVEAVEVDLDGATGILLPDDLDPVDPPEPSVAFLPGLDPTTMGWAERGFYLGDHRPALFDTNGNAGPTVWWGGQVVGGWAQRTDGEIAVKLLVDVGRDADAAIHDEADRLRGWMGAVRVTPRFRTPLERALSA